MFRIPPFSSLNDNRNGQVWMTLVKVLIVILVVAFIAKAAYEAQSSFVSSGFSVRNVDFRWLFLASLGYLAGMLPMAFNWHRVLGAMGAEAPKTDTLRAHYLSQLGKYVPGKAVVVAIRMSMLRAHSVKPMTLFISIVAETLAMMSVGSVLAAVIIAILYWNRLEIALVAMGLAVMAWLPILPPVLRFALEFVQARKWKKSKSKPDADEPLLADLKQTLTWRTLVPGWIGIFPGWILLGLSMWATMRAMNVAETADLSLMDLPWITATYAISVVAGFLSMLPGGVGIRELVLKEMLEPTYGPVVSLVAPIFHRMAILAAELILAALLFMSLRLTRNK